MNSLNFRQDQAWGDLVLRWWNGLETDRGARAALRRASDITAVVMLPAYQQLHRQLRGAGFPVATGRDDNLAAAAGLLSHVKKNIGLNLPMAMSQREGDKPCLSPLRFQRLLDSADIDALFPALRRSLPLIQYQTDVLALANDVFNWDDIVRKRWAYAYDWPDKSST